MDDFYTALNEQYGSAEDKDPFVTLVKDMFKEHGIKVFNLTRLTDEEFERDWDCADGPPEINPFIDWKIKCFYDLILNHCLYKIDVSSKKCNMGCR